MSESNSLHFMRAGNRVNSRIPVRLEWSESGSTAAVDGKTVDISPKGCLAVAPKDLTVGQKLRVTNSVSLKQCEAVLIWRGHQTRTGWELGIELQNPPYDFWEVDF